MDRKTEIGNGEDDLISSQRLEEVFELERCSSWVKEKGLNNVALQFPDGLLRHAPKVALHLEKELGQR